MTFVERIGERLARRTTRREAVVRGGAALFGLAAAWATQGPFGSGALAAACARRSPYPDCNPPYGLYCNALNPNYCDGARCSGGCTLDPQYYPDYPQTGCWCTAARGGRKRRYYYVCCDCQCPSADGATQGCGCRKRVWVRKR
jgi:hypothetical protein